MERQLNNSRVYEFGRFRFDPAERVLLRDGQPVSLTPKTLDLLIYLVQRRGQLVEKQTLLAALWPDTIVEEANLAYNISALRNALDDHSGASRLIQTVPKRGYRFVGAVNSVEPSNARQTSAEIELVLTKAHYLVDARLERWLEESFALIQQALEAAPTLPLAHVSMSQWYVRAAVRNRVPYTAGVFQATRHAQEAVRLAPHSAEAVGALGRSCFIRRLFGDAERTFLQALELSPSASIVLGSYSELLSIVGRHSEALQFIDRALQNDPLSGVLHEAKACALFTARDFSRCIEWCESVREATPASSQLAYFRGTSSLMLGRHEGALQDFRLALRLEPELLPARTAVVVALHRAGREQESKKLLQELERERIDPAILAEPYAALGMADRALDSLETAFRRDSPQLMGIEVNALLDPVRAHTRFRRLVAAMQLVPSRT